MADFCGVALQGVGVGTTLCLAWVRGAQEPDHQALLRRATLSKRESCALRGPGRWAPDSVAFPGSTKSAHTAGEGLRRSTRLTRPNLVASNFWLLN